MTPLTTDELKRIVELAGKASGRPWERPTDADEEYIVSACNFAGDMATELLALREQLQQAKEELHIWVCPKCSTEFEDDGSEHPYGIMCPECNNHGYSMVGVLHPKTIKRMITQEDWDALRAKVAKTETWEEYINGRQVYAQMVVKLQARIAELEAALKVRNDFLSPLLKIWDNPDDAHYDNLPQPPVSE
jgi:hypothetical protein